MTTKHSTATYVGPTEDGSKLRIDWQDGHRSEYLPLFLRLACRCAACIDEMSGEPRLDPNLVDPEVYPAAIKYVVRYALQFDWSDGHTTGIYPFDLLREICPCVECAGR
jgi:ATP-binding protein involved in chromosome partitioning